MPGLYVNSPGSIEAAKLSFLLFLVPAGLVFDRAVAAFVVFHFHSREKMLISLLIPMQMWLESRDAKLFENKKCANIEQLLSYPSADCPKFLRSICGRSLFTTRGIFNVLFLDLYFSLRGDTLRSYNSVGICSMGSCSSSPIP